MQVFLVHGQIIRHAIPSDPIDGGAACYHDFANAGRLGGMQQVPSALHVGFEVILVGKIVAVVDTCQVNDGILPGNGAA